MAATESACRQILILRGGFGSSTAASTWWRTFQAAVNSVRNGTSRQSHQKAKRVRRFRRRRRIPDQREVHAPGKTRDPGRKQWRALDGSDDYATSRFDAVGRFLSRNL